MLHGQYIYTAMKEFEIEKNGLDLAFRDLCEYQGMLGHVHSICTGPWLQGFCDMSISRLPGNKHGKKSPSFNDLEHSSSFIHGFFELKSPKIVN